MVLSTVRVPLVVDGFYDEEFETGEIPLGTPTVIVEVIKCHGSTKLRGVYSAVTDISAYVSDECIRLFSIWRYNGVQYDEVSVVMIGGTYIFVDRGTEEAKSLVALFNMVGDVRYGG